MDRNKSLPDDVNWPSDTNFRWFAIDADGRGGFYSKKPERYSYANYFCKECQYIYVGYFRFSKGEKWVNSIIERK